MHLRTGVPERVLSCGGAQLNSVVICETAFARGDDALQTGVLESCAGFQTGRMTETSRMATSTRAETRDPCCINEIRRSRVRRKLATATSLYPIWMPDVRFRTAKRYYSWGKRKGMAGARREPQPFALSRAVFISYIRLGVWKRYLCLCFRDIKPFCRCAPPARNQAALIFAIRVHWRKRV